MSFPRRQESSSLAEVIENLHLFLTRNSELNTLQFLGGFQISFLYPVPDKTEKLIADMLVIY